MKKLAICIPSYNESKNIENITKLIDESLIKYDKDYEIEILNCDNNSPDLTNKIFNETKTFHKKISVVTDKKGKGINLYNFFKYVIDNDIDYCITLDADLKSFNSSWMDKYLEMLEKDYDFICPLYKRRKEEGNTTNHFVVPILYMLYGKFIRQPIAGDYAFNKNYVEKILEEEFTPNILEYGIDIFMVVTAIVKNLKIGEVYLGEKVHGASYEKFLKIFNSVVLGMSETYNHYPMKLNRDIINFIPYEYDITECEFRNHFNEIYKDYLQNYDKNKYGLYKEQWNKILNEYLDNILNVDNELLDKMGMHFFYRVVSFWDEMDRIKNKEWEEEIIKFIKDLEESYEITNS